MNKIFSGKTILITGGTGSLGSSLTKKILESKVKQIRIFSRDESKQEDLKYVINDDRLRFLIGDIRDKERLKRAMEDIDIVIHTAALKQVPAAEYNPFEFIKTNIYGSQNVIDASMDAEVDICLGISTDKAVSPLNLYGSTKLAMEKLFIAANRYKGQRKTKFSCVRYGNVFGSRGSVVPKFLEYIKQNNKIQVTNPKMTRFNISMDDAMKLIFQAIEITKGSEVFIPKLYAYTLSDLIDALRNVTQKNFKINKIPIRNGEKTHEILLNKFEIPYSIESNNMYILLPPEKILQKKLIKTNFVNVKQLKFNVYSSEFANKMSKSKLESLIKNYILIEK
jgi:UDP-N-acetylglucosamine 4,6-dehydratase/5-epimerase